MEGRKAISKKEKIEQAMKEEGKANACLISSYYRSPPKRNNTCRRALSKSVRFGFTNLSPWTEFHLKKGIDFDYIIYPPPLPPPPPPQSLHI